MRSKWLKDWELKRDLREKYTPVVPSVFITKFPCVTFLPPSMDSATWETLFTHTHTIIYNHSLSYMDYLNPALIAKENLLQDELRNTTAVT